MWAKITMKFIPVMDFSQMGAYPGCSLQQTHDFHVAKVLWQ